MGEVPGTIYGLSAKGWIDYELFDVWFNNHFLHYAPSARPLLLLMDKGFYHFLPHTGSSEHAVVFTAPKRSELTWWGTGF